jgi:hypothetical protein
MESPRKYWPIWADFLKRYQLEGFAARLLEDGGPLSLVGAQALYFGRTFFVPEHMDALAYTLETETESQAFALYLLQEDAS